MNSVPMWVALNSAAQSSNEAMPLWASVVLMIISIGLIYELVRSFFFKRIGPPMVELELLRLRTECRSRE